MSNSLQQNAALPKDQLSVPQMAALEALLAGQTVTAASIAAGVDRATLHRWLKSDPVFGAALNGARKLAQEAMQARLFGLADKAADTVRQALDAGDVRTALALLKGLSLLNGLLLNAGSDDPHDLAADAAMKRRRQKLMGAFSDA